MAAVAVLGAPAKAASSYTAHGPILIEGNAGFTSANGVVSGNGTPTDPYRIEGWSISAGSADGIVVRNTTAPFLIFNVIVYSGGYSYNGIVLDNVSNVFIQSATLSHDATGVVLRDVSNVTLVANAALLNAWNGVDLTDCRDVFLNGNSVTYNRDGITVQESQRVRMSGNSISLNSQDGLYVYNVTEASLLSGVVASNGWSGIELQGGVNVGVSVNQFLSNGRLGLVVSSVDGLQIAANSFFSNPGGSLLANGVTNVTIDSNTVSPAGASGIVVEGAQGVSITGNLVSQANYTGILLAGVGDLNVSLNTLSNNDVGVAGVNISSASLTNNRIGTSAEQGVSLIGSRSVTVQGNNVSRNGAGIVIDSTAGGVVRANTLWQNAYGAEVIRSRGIAVYNNTFLENAGQGYDDGSGANRWDDGYPAGGNYWSDYIGVDLCSGPNQSVCIDPDGIGDTPYSVGLGVDRYPLMRIPGSSPKVPIASFVVAPAEGNTTTLFVFDASSSYDLEDPSGALLVRWDLDGDGIWDSPWTTNRTTTHRFDSPGNYAVRLEVLDLSGLMNTKVQVLRVGAAPPPPPSLLERLLPWLIVGGIVAIVAASIAYRRVRAKWARIGNPSWRLPPGPPR